MHARKESINYRSTNFMSEAQTATYLMRSKGTLRNWRGRGTHEDILPTYQTDEGVFYNTADVLSFCKKRGARFTVSLAAQQNLILLHSANLLLRRIATKTLRD